MANLRSYIFALTLLFFGIIAMKSAYSETHTTDIASRFITSDKVKLLEKKEELANGLSYFKLKWKELVAHVVFVDSNSKRWKVVPVVSDKLETTSKLLADSGGFVAINAGYFNMTDGVSASYVVCNGEVVCDPTQNEALVENKNLKPFLTQIFDRREFRIYENDKGDRLTKVEKHSQGNPSGYKLKSSMQAGPQLLPNLSSVEGAFIRKLKSGKKVDSIGTRLKAARSAVGITKDGICLVLIEGHRKKEFSTGASLTVLAQFMKELGCTSALNLDGGTSSTLVVKSQPASIGLKSAVKSQGGYTVLFSNDPERPVKSALVVVPVSD